MTNHIAIWTDPFNLLLLSVFIQSVFLFLSFNTVVSVLLLISIFVTISIIYMIVGAEFMALALVIIYVGAISILFLFVIMMLNLRVAELYNQYTVYAPVGYFVGICFLNNIQLIMHQSVYHFPNLLVIKQSEFSEDILNPIDWSNTITNKTNINFIGEVLYNHYYVYIWFAVLFF